MGDGCCLQKQGIRWGTDLCWKIGECQNPLAHGWFSEQIPWFPWSPNSHCGKKEIKSDEDHQKKTTTTTIQSHPSTSAQNACFFGRKTYIIGETMGMFLLFFFKFLVGNIWVKSHWKWTNSWVKPWSSHQGGSTQKIDQLPGETKKMADNQPTKTTCRWNEQLIVWIYIQCLFCI